MSCFPQSEEDGLGVSQWNKPSILQRKNLRIFKEHITAFWNVPTLTQCKYFDINKWTKYWHLKVLLPQRYIYIYIHRIVYKLFTIFPSHKKSSFCLCCDDHKLGMKSYHLKKKKGQCIWSSRPGLALLPSVEQFSVWVLPGCGAGSSTQEGRKLTPSSPTHCPGSQRSLIESQQCNNLDHARVTLASILEQWGALTISHSLLISRTCLLKQTQKETKS